MEVKPERISVKIEVECEFKNHEPMTLTQKKKEIRDNIKWLITDYEITTGKFWFDVKKVKTIR